MVSRSSCGTRWAQDPPTLPSFLEVKYKIVLNFFLDIMHIMTGYYYSFQWGILFCFVLTLKLIILLNLNCQHLGSIWHFILFKIFYLFGRESGRRIRGERDKQTLCWVQSSRWGWIPKPRPTQVTLCLTFQYSSFLFVFAWFGFGGRRVFWFWFFWGGEFGEVFWVTRYIYDSSFSQRFVQRFT